MKRINSKVFGEDIDLLEESDPEMEVIVKMVSKYPINVFQHLNKKLNTRGLCLLLDILNPSPIVVMESKVVVNEP